VTARQRSLAGAAETPVVALLRQGRWRSLPTETVIDLAARAALVEYDAGYTVYVEAGTERLAVLASGLLRVYMHAADGREVTVRYVRRGELLGVPAMVGGPAPVFVQAITASAAHFLDLGHVKEVARRDPAVAWVLAEECVDRLYDVLEELAGNAFATVRQRVARHLFDLAAARPAAAARLTATINQQDLANSVGSVREVVARVLRELRTSGLIRTRPGHVEILDPDRLSLELWSRVSDGSHRRAAPASTH
jgi:CRP/FNR family transcriptional regulator